MLGLLLNDLHATNHISTTILSQGLCSPAMLKKYMTGQRKPEKLLGDALCLLILIKISNFTDKPIIFISHRLSTVMIADKILILQGGTSRGD